MAQGPKGGSHANEHDSDAKGQAMVDPEHDPQEEFAQTREHEYQNPHYHDEDPDILDDEDQVRRASHATSEKKKMRRPPPKPRHYED